MDDSHMMLRSSLRASVSVSQASQLYKKKCCQSACEATIDRTLDSVMERLTAGDILMNSTAASLVEEPYESDTSYEADRTLIDAAYVSDVLSEKLELFKKMNTYKLTELRCERDRASQALLQEKLTWLDEILNVAKAEFGSKEIGLLPKTPVAKKQHRQLVARRSSPPVNPATLVRPIRQTRRTAAQQAKLKITSKKGVRKSVSLGSRGKRASKRTTRSLVDIEGKENQSPSSVASSENCIETKAGRAKKPKLRKKGQPHRNLDLASSLSSEEGQQPGSCKLVHFGQLQRVKEKVEAFEQMSGCTPLKDHNHKGDALNLLSTSGKSSQQSKGTPTSVETNLISSDSVVEALEQDEPRLASTPDQPTSADTQKTPVVWESYMPVTPATIIREKTDTPPTVTRLAAAAQKVTAADGSPELDKPKAVKKKSKEKPVDALEEDCSVGKSQENSADSKEEKFEEVLAASPSVKNMTINADSSVATDLEQQKRAELNVRMVDTEETQFCDSLVMGGEKTSPSAAEKTTIIEKGAHEPSVSLASTLQTEVNIPPISGPVQRMTRSKMRAQPPSTSSATQNPKPSAAKPKSPTRTMSPARMQSPARTKSPARGPIKNRNDTVSRAASADRSRVISRERTESNKKSLLNSKSGRPRTSSESSLYNTSSVVKSLTKAASYSRLNRAPNMNTSMSKQHTVSTPDISRTQSVVKSFLKGGTQKTSPQQTPSLGRTVVSFIKRATPIRMPSREEETQKKEQRLKEKEEQERQRHEEKKRIRDEHIEEKKRELAEKLKRAQELRQAKLAEQKSKQEELAKKSQHQSELANQVHEKKVKEEKQRALLRAQKLHEAEERRKKEEEKRRVKQKANEVEKLRQVEAKKKLLEAEKHKVNEADQKRQNEHAQKKKVNEEQKQKKPSIYEIMESKATALSEERKAIIAMQPIGSAAKDANKTFTLNDCEPDFIDVSILTADDEFDDPKFVKCIVPKWAQGDQLNRAVVVQYEDTRNNFKRSNEILGTFRKYTPDLTELFKVHKPRFFKRTSSANWSSPPIKEQRMGK
ncbi:inner centromere protein A-like isoform X2 [Watersipora subatra]|uniref:inner centromere protein A-like isoform X2 n=1 Tax=Watersipora subatra TaxID=2589382 RepID=UPI00355C11F0